MRRWGAALLVLMLVPLGCGDAIDEAPASLSRRGNAPRLVEVESSLEGSPPTTKPDTSVAQPWVEMAPAPIAARAYHAAVWTGVELVVWGGDGGRPHDADGRLSFLSDGAAFRPDTGVWRVLPPAPLEGRYSPVGVWTGKEMVVLGGADNDLHGSTEGAAFNPVANRWRRIAASPLPPLGYVSVEAIFDGREVIVVGVTAPRSRRRPDGTFVSEPERFVAAAYDPAADRWRSLPDPPLEPRMGFTLAMLDGSLFVVGGRYGCLGCGHGTPTDEETAFTVPSFGVAFDISTGRWRELAAGPVWPLDQTVASDGDQLIAWGPTEPDYEPYRAATFDPRDETWAAGSNTAFKAWGGAMDTVWTGEEAWTWASGSGAGEQIAAYNPRTRAWRTLPTSGLASRDGASTTWTGDALIVWGGSGHSVGFFADGAIVSADALSSKH